MKRRDPLTIDLFEVPTPVASYTGGMDFRAQVAGLVSTLLKNAPGDRYAVAAECSRLTGKDVTKYMLDAYASESREEFNIPLHLAAALEAATESYLLSSWLAEVRGGRLLIGREALTAELGKLERQRDQASKMIREIKKQMGNGQ